jgi:hypothetical protein
MPKTAGYTRPVAKAIGRSAKGKPGAKRKALGADSVSFRNISTVSKQLIKLLEVYKKLAKEKGSLKQWSDPLVLKIRNQFRQAAKKHRGEWSIEFYETLQAINKESLKRGQNPAS